MAETVGTVTGLWRYPVKSMQGEPLSEATITEAGVPGDRAYALIDADGKIVSAKHPRKWGRLLECRAAFVDHPEPGHAAPPVRITFPDGTEARSDDADIDAVLSGLLGREVHLTSVTPGERVISQYHPDVEGVMPQQMIDDTLAVSDDPDEVITTASIGLLAPDTFFDLARLHVITTSTLDRLAELAPGVDFAPRRFRPNVVVRTDAAGFTENEWIGDTVTVGALTMRVDLPVPRCVMTTLAQPDLAPDRRVLQTIARENRVEIPGFGTFACAGVYATPTTTGLVSVGALVSAA